jgi:putative membrane protein
MKRKSLLLLSLPFALLACNNEAKDSVEKADSANEAKLDSNGKGGQTITTDEATTNFLVKAADGGMAEVQTGQLAEQKASNAQVKGFATMMVNEHSAANNQVKAFASARNVTLPDSVSDAHKKHMNDLTKKSGKDFDKSYMNMMVDDHQDVIRMFKDASDDVKDAEVKTFIDNTIPKLQMHLDSAQAIQKRIR